MLSSLYRKLIPLHIRQSIYDFFLGSTLFFIRNFKVIARSKATFFFQYFLPKTELNKAYAFIGRYGITSYPHEYMLEYRNKKINVSRDEREQLLFVLHNGKKLFFPVFYTEEKVIKDYRALIIEQDLRAAHRYVRSYDELKDKTLLDIGSAEGIFSLDTIELVKHVYLFECMEHWQKPLRATFAQWTDKVTIVPKYVGDKTEGNFVTIDDFMTGKTIDSLFLKMDIEGAERMALAGATKVISKGRNNQAAICTYHRIGDPEFIDDFFKRHGYSTEFSEGLMYWNRRLSKGILRAKN